MGSFKDDSGTHQLPFSVQKLLKYDDHTVCAIAGLGQAKVPAAPQLNADLLGVVVSYRDEIQSKSINQPIAGTLAGLSAVLQFYLSGSAEINAKTGNDRTLSDYHLQLLLVGYDLDGKPKIGQLVLAVGPQQEPAGGTRWVAHELQNAVVPVTKELRYSVGGMSDVAVDALRHPEKFNTHKIMAAYAEGIRKDQGASTLEEMEQLGKALIGLTAQKHAEVGRDIQVAVLQSGLQDVHDSFILGVFHPLLRDVIARMPATLAAQSFLNKEVANTCMQQRKSPP
jgi:20S proteasome alpha/beta subunit